MSEGKPGPEDIARLQEALNRNAEASLLEGESETVRKYMEREDGGTDKIKEKQVNQIDETEGLVGHFEKKRKTRKPKKKGEVDDEEPREVHYMADQIIAEIEERYPNAFNPNFRPDGGPKNLQEQNPRQEKGKTVPKEDNSVDWIVDKARIPPLLEKLEAENVRFEAAGDLKNYKPIVTV